MTKTTNCDVCRHSGLALFFLRWGAVALDSTLAPPHAPNILTDANLAAAMGLPSIKQSRYVLRVLRAGYLHVYHEKAPKWLAAAKKKSKEKDAAHWEVYRVTPSGALIPDTHHSFNLTEDFQCKTDPTHIFTAMAYRLREAHKSGKIWVAFSANDWNSTLRDQNKMQETEMQCFDIPGILKGQKPKNSVAPDGNWIDAHVAEFATSLFKHGGLDPTYPFKSHLKNGAPLAKRFAELDGADKETKGKSLVVVLNDPAGTATELADIAKARYQKGVDHAEKKRQPIGAASRIKMLRDQTRIGETMKPAAPNELMSSIKTDAQGRPLDNAGRKLFMDKQLEPLPPVSERQLWRSHGVMSVNTFQAVKMNRGLPATARWFQLDNDPSMGWVFVPIEDMVELRTDLAMAKMNRLHRRKDMADFIKTFDGEMEKHEIAVDEFDSDRCAWLKHDGLKRYFQKHFDPAQDDANACNAYMSDACGALISWGGVSTSIEKVVGELLDAKPESLDGWALRAMVANQKSIYSNLAEFWQHGVDWTTNIDNRLDKAYDSLAFILFDADDNFKLAAKFNWLKPTGIGLSFGLMGFIGGASTHLLGKAIAKESPNHAKNAQDAMAKLESFIDRKSGDVKSSLVAAELNRAMKIQAWCHQKALLFEGYLTKQPAARPVYGRVTLRVDQAVEVLLDYRAQGMKFNQATRKTLADWQRMPEAARSKTVDLDFLTTDHALAEAQKTDKVIADADRVRVATRRAGTPVVMATTASLGKMYRQAHRYDGLNKALVNFVDKTAPQLGGRLNTLSSMPGKVGVSMARGTTAWKGQFSLWGAVLQGRGLWRNMARWENLKVELEKIPNLTNEQKAAINDEILMVELGMADNLGGIVGGTSELAAVGARSLKLVGVETLMGVLGAFGGAAGSFANAWQNWNKAEGKTREGDQLFASAYTFVGRLYFTAGLALALNGLAIIAQWAVKRFAIQAGIRLTTVLAFGATKLNAVGWVATLIAFIAEGIVNWYDRTKMEAWVENSYFGKEPKFKGWEDEEEGFEAAMKDMQEQALRAADGTLPEGAK